MKVLYQTVPSYFDLEISLIRELVKEVELKVLLIVSPTSMHSSAFSIDSIDSRCDIIPATEYKGMEKYQNMINLDNWYIANNPDNSLFHSLSLAKKIRKFYRTNGFTFFHSTTDCKTALMNLPFYASLKNKLYTNHDPIPHNKLSWIADLVRYRFLCYAFKNLMFLSDSLLDPFCNRYGFAKENIYFSRLSVYDFLLSHDQTPNPYGDYILFFGRIDEYKGVGDLVDAYVKSEASSKGVKLVIAGKGELKCKLEQLPQNILFINRYIHNKELACLIRNCKFVVLPYRTATQSGCVMSAFAFNKPILATSVGDLPNEVINDVTGFITEPNNIDKLCENIDMMCNANLEIIEQNIKYRFSDNGAYSWSSIAKSMCDIYKTINLNNKK